MRKIYEHIDFSRVGQYQSILEGAGIPTLIKNLGAAAALGEIPFVQCYPELWVANDEDYDRSLEMLTPYHNIEIPNSGAWQCPECNETIEPSFGQCWKCQTMRPSNSPMD